jgi:hypothetical protein
MEVSGQFHDPALYPLETVPGTHWIRTRMGPTAGQDAEAKTEILDLAGNQATIVHSRV